eukprot:m.70877 g.70877  ORF g.70877 m.70877 type:complete len:87 (+) comp12179_c0_seq1:669-929(+)
MIPNTCIKKSTIIILLCTGVLETIREMSFNFKNYSNRILTKKQRKATIYCQVKVKSTRSEHEISRANVSAAWHHEQQKGSARGRSK